MRTKRTPLILKEAHINNETGSTFEDLLNRFANTLPTVSQRVHAVDLYGKIVLAEISNHDGKTFARLVELDEGATGLLDLSTSNASAQIEALDAPNQRKFVRSEAFLLARANNIVTIGMKNKSGTYLRAVLDFAERCGVNEDYRMMALTDTTDRAELERIRAIGVKEVQFSITGYLADLDPNALLGLGSNVLTRMLKRPSSEEDLRKREKSRGKIILTRGDIRSEEIETDRWLDEIAVAAYEEAESYKILLANGDQVSQDRLRVTSSVPIRTFANTLHAEEARRAMEQFWADKQRDGIIR